MDTASKYSLWHWNRRKSTIIWKPCSQLSWRTTFVDSWSMYFINWSLNWRQTNITKGLWHPLFYTSTMASSALQHRTSSPTKEGCHWQAGGENCQTRQLANLAWYPDVRICILANIHICAMFHDYKSSSHTQLKIGLIIHNWVVRFRSLLSFSLWV